LFDSFKNKKSPAAYVKGVLDNIARITPKVESKEILLLGRYNNDINRIKSGNGVFKIRRGEETSVITYGPRILGKTVKLELQFLTVHNAKGLEADIVIVMNCNSGKFGFPSEMSDDPVLNLLLSEAEQFENGEETFLCSDDTGKRAHLFNS
jgi:DNA helicase-4